jgi:carboxyl-terminal processing protease
MRFASPVALSLALSWGSACLPNAAPGAGDSPAPAPAAPEVDAEAQLRLEERAFPLLIWAAFTVQQEYFEPGRIDPPGQLRSALHDLALHAPEFFAEPAGEGVFKVTVGAFSQNFTVGAPATLLAAAEQLEKILEFTRAHLDLEGDEAVHRLEYAALNGLLAPLDPHTILLTPEERSDLGIKTKGEFGGVGAEINVEARRIKIVRVLPGSPAELAGLLAGDVILQIDRQATVNLPAADAQSLLRGPVGAPVVLKVKRGAEALTFTIIRQNIRVDSVIASLLPEQIALLRITTFQENTAEQVRQAITRLGAEPPLRGVILDLRGNSGGLLTQAMALVDLMVREGELVIVRSALGRESDPATAEQLFAEDVAVVALIDENAASAAEIVSGGVQALGRGVVLGRTSFGKGTVQMLKAASPYGRELALKLTVAEYLVAGDTKIQSLGVRPDFALYPVELTELASVARYYDRERFERRRERSQIAHLPSARHEPPAPEEPDGDAVLRYFGRARELAEGEPDALRDPEVAIARSIAAALVGVPRASRVAAARAVVDAIAADEDAALVAALAARSISWKGALRGGADPSLSVQASVDGPIRAGKPFVLRVEVQNSGSEPAERLHLITECVHDELDGIEVLLGALAPGESVSRELRLQVMSWHPDFAEDLRLAVHSGEPGPTPDGRVSVRLEVSGQPRPHLAYDYWIVDDPALAAAAPKRPGDADAFEIKGNGDGVLQAGEQVLLAVQARGRGAAVSDARALLRNHGGAQGLLEEGFLALGPIAAGGEVAGSFGLTVAAAPDLTLPLELDLMVADVQLRESARHRLRPRISEARPPFVAAAARYRVKDEGARLYNGADAKSPVLGELAAGYVFESTGASGGWLAIALAPGRRAWIPADLAEEAGPRDRAAPPPARPALVVEPPKISIEAPPRTIAAAELELSIRAEHPRRLRDLVVSAQPVGPAQVEDKVLFFANPAREGDASRSVATTAKIPLTKAGGHRITVTARDGDGVEAHQEVLVFRE